MELPLGCSLPASATLGYLQSTSTRGDEGIFLSSDETIDVSGTIHVSLATSESTHMTCGNSGITDVSPANNEATHVTLENRCDEYQQSGRAARRS
jgi:hypothetical protein